MFVRSAGRAVRHGAVFVSAAVACAQTLSSPLVRAEPSQASSPLAMIEPAATVPDARAKSAERSIPGASEPTQGGNRSGHCRWAHCRSLAIGRSSRPRAVHRRRPWLRHPMFRRRVRRRRRDLPSPIIRCSPSWVRSPAKAREWEFSSMKPIRPRCACGPARATRDAFSRRSAAGKLLLSRASGPQRWLCCRSDRQRRHVHRR
jgi:hypothetical protein